MISQYDYQVCSKIYEFDYRGEELSFTRLVDEVKGTPYPVSGSLDRLRDTGLIRYQWEKKDGQWEMCLHITNEFLGLIESLVNIREVKE